MDGIGRVESGTETESEAGRQSRRLYGCRRYDSMDGIGRVESGSAKPALGYLRPRAKHDPRDKGGRNASGTAFEEARAGFTREFAASRPRI
jgi:hypothetical protein